MLQTTINNYVFNYKENGTGEDLLFVHGSASDYRTWDKQQQVFSKNYHTLTYSRRYHWPNKQITGEDKYSMEQHVEDLAGFINCVGNKPVNLAGHSYGAFICLLLAIKYPMLIKSMILAEPPAITLYVSNNPKPLELIKLLLKKPKTAVALIKFGAKGIGPATAAVKRGDMKMALEIFGKAILGKEFFNNLSKTRKDQAFSNLIKDEFLGSGFPPLDKEKIKNINITTLFLTGENSPALFHYLIDSLHELLPDSEQKTIPGASHIMHEDNPENYNSIVLSFLEKNMKG